MSYLPLFLKGEVVKGFGRGSKDLGCPTGNINNFTIIHFIINKKPVGT